MLGESADGERAGNPDPQLPGEQLVEKEDLPAVQGLPQLQHSVSLLIFRRFAEREEPVLDQARERRRLAARRPAAALGVDEQRDRFREIPGDAERFLEQPTGDARALAAPGSQKPGRDQPLQASAGEKIQRPGGVGGGGLRKVGLHRHHLRVGRSSRVEGVVEGGEVAQGDQSPSGSAGCATPMGAASIAASSRR